jgi:hypothetical protein
MLWIPSHVGVRSNERADQLAGDAVENGIESHAHCLHSGGSVIQSEPKKLCSRSKFMVIPLKKNKINESTHFCSNREKKLLVL